jgi:hypothetical protein
MDISEVLPGSPPWIALALSAIALGVSLRANRHAKRSADASEVSAQAAKETARIDRERHHRERKPQFTVTSELIPDRGLEIGGMWIKLDAPMDLDEVRAKFEPPGVSEPTHVRQVTVNRQWSLEPNQEMPEGFPLRMGDRFSVMFHLDDPDDPDTRSTPVRLRLICRREGWDPWTEILEGATPSWPTVFVV